MNTTILYYTNNLLPPKLLENTLLSAIGFCRGNNNEIIITSHFPITKNYESIDLTNSKEDRMYSGKINLQTKEARLSNIYKYLVKDLSVDMSGVKYQSYVVDKMPYTHKSIFKQIIYSLSKARNENIVFMEHDCFYPLNYLEKIEWAVIKYDCKFQYVHQNVCYLDFDGYFKADTRFMLSGCSGKRDCLREIFENKLELLNHSKPYYYEPLLEECTEEMKKKYSGEILVRNYACVDEFLQSDLEILDVKHKLNQGGQLSMLRNASGALKNYKHMDNHSYWGEPSKYLDMININMDRESEAETILGTGFF